MCVRSIKVHVTCTDYTKSITKIPFTAMINFWTSQVYLLWHTMTWYLKWSTIDIYIVGEPLIDPVPLIDTYLYMYFKKIKWWFWAIYSSISFQTCLHFPILFHFISLLYIYGWVSIKGTGLINGSRTLLLSPCYFAWHTATHLTKNGLLL